MERSEANDLIAAKFTRMMNATVSRYGLLSDVASASVFSGAMLLFGLFVLRHEAGSSGRNLILALSVIPIVASLAAAAALSGAREKVVSWLASVPFPVENLNAILAGTSDTVELVFARKARMPKRAELMPALERLSDDLLVVAERAEDNAVEIKLGVIDSKRWPMLTNHRRYRRLVDLVEGVLVPLRREGSAILLLRVL